MTPRQQKIINVYKQTGSTTKAAERLGISHQAVRQALVRASFPREKEPLSYDIYVDESMPLIQEMLDDGDSLAEIAQICGMSPDTLGKHLRARGIETNRQPRYNPEDRQAWERMHASGLSPYAIAKQTGVPRQTIDAHIRAKGLSRDRAKATKLGIQLSKRQTAAATSPRKRAS